MKVNRLIPEVGISSNKITWTPRYNDFDVSLFYRGKTVTADEFTTLFLNNIYQANYTADSLVEILDKLPDVYMLKSTKYGASLSVSGTSVQLKDQDGNALGNAITTQDTGATSVEVTGSGDAVTSASYDATSRKITFTKGSSFLASSTKYAASIALSMDSSTYVVTAQLKDQDGNNIGEAKTVDLPLESVVVSGAYDSTNKKVILTLKSGSTIDFSVADLISGLVSSSRTIAGVDLADNITKSELLTALNVADGAQVNTVNSVNTKTGAVVLSYSDVGAEAAFTKNTAFNKDFETSTTNIKANGTASVGSATTIARADHVHPSDTTKLDANQGSTNSGKFLKVGSDGTVAPYTLDLSGYASKATIESYTVASNSWTALSSSEPFTYQTTVTATYTIGNDTEIGIINDQAILFANYGFIVGSVSGQSVTIYSIAQPDSSVTLKIGYRG